MARTPMWVIAILGALLCGAPAWAQDDEIPQPAPRTPVPFYGTVFLPDGSPAANAEVEFAVWGKDYVEATTDAVGGYSAMLPDAGTLVVEARIRGVAISKRLVVRALDPEHAVALDVHLHAAPVLSGVVYTQSGAPAANMALRSYGMRGRTNYVPPADGIPPEQVDYGGGWGGGGMPAGITTDGLGRYSVPLLDIGGEINCWPPPSINADGTEYDLVLVAPGGQGWARLECRVDLDMPEVHQDTRLQPGARVRGMVIGYPGGTPMAGVHVQVGTDVPGAITGHGGPAIVEEVVSDEEGRFGASAVIPPEFLRVTARPPAGWAVMVEEWPRQDPTPGDRYVEIALVRDPIIEGQVFGLDGSALANRRVAFGNGLEADTDDGGRYRLKLEPGFTFYGEPPARWRYQWLSARVPRVGVATPVCVDLTEEPLRYDFHLSPPATVTGNEIEKDEGIKAVGVRVRLVPAVEGVPARELEGASGLCFDGEHSVAKDDDTGVYRLEGVPPGEYWLETSDWTVHSLTVEKGNAVRVSVPPGGGTVTVDTFIVDYLPRFNVRLLRGPSDLASYEVTGFARPAGSSGPGSEIFVWHWPEEEDRYLVWARGLYPGRYELAIVARGGAGRYVTAMQTMDLTGDPPGDDLSFDLGGAAVTGRVVLPDAVTGIPHVTVTGRAVAGDAVLLNGEMSDWAHFQVETDGSGRFAITGLLPGEYEVGARLPEEFYGPSPTARVRVRVNDRVGVVLRAEKVDW